LKSLSHRSRRRRRDKTRLHVRDPGPRNSVHDHRVGHRANYVIIEQGKGTAYRDQWGALGCTFLLGDGPAECKKFAREHEKTSTLMDWAEAEAGFLVDFDQRRCIAFGHPDYDGDDLPASDRKQLDAFMVELEKGPAAMFQYIGDKWQGWTMVWDTRGTDAFSDYLAARKIKSIKSAADSEEAEGVTPRVELAIPRGGKAVTVKKPRSALVKPKAKPAARKPAAKAKATTKRRA